MRPALIVLLLKGLLFLAGYLGVLLLPPIFSVEGFRANFHWPADQKLSLVTMLKTWDAQHYLFLAEEGYQPGHMSNAMYPLWPFLIRVGSAVFGNSLAAALVLSNLCSLAGLTLFHRYVQDRHGVPAADRALLLLAAFPGAFFFCLAYTESLFLLLAISCFLAMDRRRFAMAAVFAFLLSMTRAVGLFILFPLAWTIYRAWREQETPGRSLAWTLAPVLGFGAVFLVMQRATGNAFAHLEAQGAYQSVGSIVKIFNVPQLLESFFTMKSGHGVLDSPFDRLSFVFALIGLALMFRNHKLYFLFAFPVALVPAASMSFMAYTRYVVAAFPLFIIFGIALARSNRPEVRWVTYAALAAIQLIFVILHVNSYWVG